jgi:hypothetical protein
VVGATSGEVWGDALGADGAAVLLVVIAAVGVQITRAAARPPALAPHPWDRADQWEELGD